MSLKGCCSYLTFTNGALKHTWTFDSAAPGWEAYSGMGNDSVTVADFDGDGCVYFKKLQVKNQMREKINNGKETFSNRSNNKN